jgi:hypothetical protein
MELFKQILILLLVAVSFQANVSAQNRNQQYQKVKLGLVLTPQLSWLSCDNPAITNESPAAGISYGLLIDYFFSKNYAISTALLMSHTGGKLKFNGQGFQLNSTPIPQGQEIKYNLSYVELPVGLKLKTKLFRRTIYYGQIGLTPMVNTRSHDQFDRNLSKEVGLLNVAYHFGGGIEYSLGGETFLNSSVFFTKGIFDTLTNKTFNDKTTLSTINLRVGINF